VQTLILSCLVQSIVQIDSTDDGIEKLKRYFSSCDAFLILDDVDNVQQVEALLLPVKDVLHQGSLILLTSRNIDVLTSSGILEFYFQAKRTRPRSLPRAIVPACVRPAISSYRI
jgi:hypothetical protein